MTTDPAADRAKDGDADVTVRPLRPGDGAEWLRLRQALWPRISADDQEAEMTAIRADSAHQPVFDAARPDGSLGGFVEVALRETATGCSTSPVGSLEAWYVDPALRGQGAGRRLAEAAEAWARSMGCREMASDTTHHYPLSARAHAALGYEVVEAAITFRMSLAAE